jgi:hypothetical protein
MWVRLTFGIHGKDVTSLHVAICRIRIDPKHEWKLMNYADPTHQHCCGVVEHDKQLERVTSEWKQLTIVQEKTATSAGSIPHNRLSKARAQSAQKSAIMLQSSGSSSARRSSMIVSMVSITELSATASVNIADSVCISMPNSSSSSEACATSEETEQSQSEMQTACGRS